MSRRRLTGLLGACLALAALTTGCEAVQQEVALPEAEETAEPEEPAAPTLFLRLPTSNDALLRGDEGAFYQDLDRAIPGLRPFAWEGGRYGFVRSPARTDRGLVFSQLHEGLDIRPLYRDRRGEALDTVRAVADGIVAYVNRHDNSSYGRYVVVRHRWDEAPVYSLYAHLASVAVDTADAVPAGTPLGRMGHSGRGLAPHRAHVHLEIALLLNRHFQAWFDAYYRGKNLHGLYFGKNLAGVDPAALYRALQEEPDLTFAAFVRRQPVAYRLALPGERPLDLLTRYPWLGEDGVSLADTAGVGAWVVSFTREGVPVRVARQAEAVTAPEVVYVAAEVRQHRLSTGGYLAWGGASYHLTRAGRAYAALLATTAEGVPDWF